MMSYSNSYIFLNHISGSGFVLSFRMSSEKSYIISNKVMAKFSLCDGFQASCFKDSLEKTIGG